MAFTRKALQAMDIDADKIDSIISLHMETVNALKEELVTVKKDFDVYKADSEKDIAKAKSEAEKSAKEYADYKAETEKKADNDKRAADYRKIIKDNGIADKYIDSVLKVSALSEIEYDKEGNIKNADAIGKSVKENFSDFIPSVNIKGADTPTPPKNTAGKQTKEDILNIKDTTERQKAIAENHELFGF
jgi:hypothetical protein